MIVEPPSIGSTTDERGNSKPVRKINPLIRFECWDKYDNFSKVKGMQKLGVDTSITTLGNIDIFFLGSLYAIQS